MIDISRSKSRHRRTLYVLAALLASASFGGSAPSASASSADAQATHAYLIAQYRLATALVRKAASASKVESAAAARIGRECPGVVSGMPPESLLRSPSARVRGENARLAQQKKTLGNEIDVAVIRAANSLELPAEEAYAAEVRPLSWSNPTIATTLQTVTAARLEALSASAPRFCADARAWAKSGYRTLSTASREFQASQAARKSSREAEPAIGTLLKPYENGSDRKLLRKTNTLSEKLLAITFAAVQPVLELDQTVGLLKTKFKERKPVKLGYGRTSAGTHFEVTSGSGPLGLGGSCRHSATVAYSRPGKPEVLIVGGPNNPICLSPPRYRRPAHFCEAGIETIQTAVPPSVRSVRLTLADGQTITSRVVSVARRHGGPSGIYAQEIRGSTSHAVSLVELNSSEGIVLTLKLPRYRCVKSRAEPEGFPTLATLASGHTPEGEAFTISAFGSLKGEPFLTVDTGVNPELDETTVGPQAATKAFPWSLSIGCAPHPYTIIYGILAPPGKSVVAQTSQGAVPLNVVPVKPRLDADGPLVYGVFSQLPSELTILGTNGATVYTESLQAKAAEAAQFCEGYAEP